MFQDVSAMTEEEQLALALQMSMSGAMEGAMETELATDQVTLLVQSEAHCQNEHERKHSVELKDRADLTPPPSCLVGFR